MGGIPYDAQPSFNGTTKLSSQVVSGPSKNIHGLKTQNYKCIRLDLFSASHLHKYAQNAGGSLSHSHHTTTGKAKKSFKVRGMGIF